MKYGVKEEEKKWFQRLYLWKGIREIDPRLILARDELHVFAERAADRSSRGKGVILFFMVLVGYDRRYIL